jgi:hypothetical protein
MHQRIQVFKAKKFDPGCSSRIRDPDPDFLPIPDPRSGSATLLFSFLIRLYNVIPMFMWLKSAEDHNFFVGNS